MFPFQPRCSPGAGMLKLLVQGPKIAPNQAVLGSWSCSIVRWGSAAPPALCALWISPSHGPGHSLGLFFFPQTVRGCSLLLVASEICCKQTNLAQIPEDAGLLGQ